LFLTEFSFIDMPKPIKVIVADNWLIRLKEWESLFSQHQLSGEAKLFLSDIDPSNYSKGDYLVVLFHGKNLVDNQRRSVEELAINRFEAGSVMNLLRSASGNEVLVIVFSGGYSGFRAGNCNVSKLRLGLQRIVEEMGNEEDWSQELLDDHLRLIEAEGNNQPTQLVKRFSTLDILVQGALTIMGLDHNPSNPWLWSGESGPEISSATRNADFHYSLKVILERPIDWFAECKEDMMALFPVVESNKVIESALAKLDLGLQTEIGKLLLPRENATVREGALIQVGKAVSRANLPLGNGCRMAIEMLRSEFWLKRAHQDYITLHATLCGSPEL
jgi:hypothetical protein